MRNDEQGQAESEFEPMYWELVYATLSVKKELTEK